MVQEVRSSVAASILNLIKNVIAAGIVTLPYVLKESSTSVGLLCMLLVSLLSAYSFWVLAQSVMLTHAPSYQALANLVLGPRWSWWTLVVLICYTLMSEISFIVVIGDFLAPTLEHLGLRGFLSSRWFVQNSVALLLLFPLSLLKDLHPLRYMSFLGSVCILYAVAVIVAEGWGSVRDPEPSVEHFALRPSLFKGLAILSIAFAAQYSIPKLVSELGVRERGKVRLVILAETLVVLVLYVAAAVFGYFRFGGAVDGDIFHSLSQANYILVAKLGLGVSAIGCFPFPFQVLRASLNEAFALPAHPRFQRLFTLLLIALCAGVALLIPRIELVLAFKGSLFGSLIVYVLPGLFFWRVSRLDQATLLRVQRRFLRQKLRLQREQQQQQQQQQKENEEDRLRGENGAEGLDGDIDTGKEKKLRDPLLLASEQVSEEFSEGFSEEASEEAWDSELEEPVVVLSDAGALSTQGSARPRDGKVRLPRDASFRDLPWGALLLPGFLVGFGAVTGVVGFVVTILKMI